MPGRAEPRAAPLGSGARRPYALHAAFAALGLTTAVVAVVGTVGAIHVDPRAAHQVRVAGETLSYPAMNLASLVVVLVAGVGAASLLRMARAWWVIARDHRRFSAGLESGGAGALTFDINGEQVKVRCFESSRPEAFCAGFLRPAIYVSTGAVELLDERELVAVAAHERQHQRVHDPLRALVARLLARGLFFLPVLGRLVRAGELRAELEADAVALRASGGDQGPLASAMLSMGQVEGENLMGIGPERVDHLLGQPVRSPLPLGLLTLGLLTVGAMIGVLWRALHAATISATFSVPLVSRQPCVLVLAMVPLALGLTALMIQAMRAGSTAG